MRSQSQQLDLVNWTPIEQVFTSGQLCESHESSTPFTVNHTVNGLLIK